MYLRWYHFFGLLWISAFIVACQDLIIAGAVPVWYFSGLLGKSGQFVDFLLKMLQCCLNYFEKFIKYLNINAYIMTASHGYNFCTGAKKAFMLLLANVLRYAAINSIGDFDLFLAKLGCVAVTVVVGYEFIKVSDRKKLFLKI